MSSNSCTYVPTPGQPESLHAIFRQLHAWREQHQEPSSVQANIAQRRTLVENARPEDWVKAGDQVAPFEVEEVDGERLTLAALLERGPLVLVFFRFAGCPACNLALPYYQRNLLPGLRERGATLLALSPQLPERLVDIKRRHRLEFFVATDRDNALGQRFGILYAPDEAARQAAQARGHFIGDVTGTGTWELPQPTAVVIGIDGTVHFADVHPDWLLRTEADTILAAVDALPVQEHHA
ncbi:peroxiredoxin-like family protein [Xylophilus sp.]|uniref:peroxiredoxin-like family protein n=1 Tax=Xylophilus sp. TaxID=2653893 RepID=UPI0013BC0344|nr:peroxiredoxin-like family protein [Xylophilus sp.]KAF1042970.1 MAG: Peroxiredoxin Bcp [Xylophilus sp.]